KMERLHKEKIWCKAISGLILKCQVISGLSSQICKAISGQDPYVVPGKPKHSTLFGVLSFIGFHVQTSSKIG
ncbi:hypothetical protein, partial [Fluviicola chungangensis]|uniref:hypothetical protein n=1 Tax=Fluviicola chungangensis TaxID=2597671 RepID=UPI001C904FA1